MKTLLMAALCLLATGVYAQKIAVESGKIDFLKNEKLITVKFTYEKMRVGKMTEEEYIEKKKGDAEAKAPGGGETWYKAWIADRDTRFEPKFIELFNKYMGEKSGVNLGTEAGGKYLLTINTHFTEPGFNVGVMRKNSSVSTQAVFTDTETGSEVAVIAIDNASANDFMGTDYDVAYRIQESYGKAGRELAKFLIKKLKL